MVIVVGQSPQVNEDHEEQCDDDVNGMQQNEGECSVLDPGRDIDTVLSDERLKAVCLDTDERASGGQCEHQTTPKLLLAFQSDEPRRADELPASGSKQTRTDDEGGNDSNSI